MPYNGSGVFIPTSLPGSFNPAQIGGSATPTDWNTLLADLATGLSTAFCKDGQSTLTATGVTNLNDQLNQVVSFKTGAVATGSTIIPEDDSIPQNSEGDEYMTLAITPRTATSTLIIDVVWNGSSSVANDLIVALFQDGAANALAASTQFTVAAGGQVVTSFRHTMTSGTTSSTTFKVRAGGALAGTTTFNGFGGARKLGGVMASSIVITERVN